eukprot:c27626_g1_i1 orf=268-3072(-)
MDMTSKLKTARWADPENEDSTKSKMVVQTFMTSMVLPMNEGPHCVAKPHGSQQMGIKRKLLNDDLPDNVHFEGLESGGDSELVLGLGCSSSIAGSQGGGGSKISSRSFLLKGTKEGFHIDLGLGLAHPVSCGSSEPIESYPTSSGGIMSSENSSAITFLDSELAMFSRTGQNLASGSNKVLEFGCLRSQSKDSGCSKVAVKGLGNGNVHSAKSAIGVLLQLGLPEGSAVVMDSDCVSATPIASTRELQETRLDGLDGLEHIPVVDEGSTSARWMKSGGYVPSLLTGHPNDIGDSNISKINGRVQSKGMQLVAKSTIQEKKTKAQELSINIKASNGTTSRSGLSVGFFDRPSKTCKFPGCGKGARGASGLCIAHGGGRRCQREGCNKGAEGRTVYCKAHGGGRRCQNLGCTKSAEGKTEYCIGHGGGRRCSHEGCNKAARGRSGLCIRHGGGKRCQKEGCAKSAEGYSGLCISHGGGRRCQFLGCGKGAQGSTLFCKAHGGGKRCIALGCTKGAEGSTPLCKAHGGGKRCMFNGGGNCTKSVHGGTQFCVAHGGGKRCSMQGCTKSARGRTDYCVRHGGGKRCKFEGCSKSAQGSTDFCKAHGGGKRCLWGQNDSKYSFEFIKDKGGELVKGPCERFARGKLGLCAAHSALFQDGRVHGDASLGHAVTAGFQPALTWGFMPVPGQKQHASFGTIKFTGASEGECEEVKTMGENEMVASPGRIGTEMAGERSYLNHSSISNGLDRASETVVNPPLDRTNTRMSSCLRSSGHWPSLSHPFLQCGSTFNVTMVDSINRKLGLGICPDKQLSHQLPGARMLVTETRPSHFPSSQSKASDLISMQKEDIDTTDAKRQRAQTCTTLESDAAFFSMASMSLPEGRVHGGDLMALLARGATGTVDCIQDIGLGIAVVSQVDNERCTDNLNWNREAEGWADLSL